MNSLTLLISTLENFSTKIQACKRDLGDAHSVRGKQSCEHQKWLIRKFGRIAGFPRAQENSR